LAKSKFNSDLWLGGGVAVGAVLPPAPEKLERTVVELSPEAQHTLLPLWGAVHFESLRCRQPSSDSRSLLVGCWLLLAGFGLVAGRWLASWLPGWLAVAEIATNVVGTRPTKLVLRSSKQRGCQIARLQGYKYANESRLQAANDFKLSDETMCFPAWWPKRGEEHTT